jgi:hypothetical protein
MSRLMDDDRSLNGSGSNTQMLLPIHDDDDDDSQSQAEPDDRGQMLLFLFIGMIFIGTLNRVYSKLQTIPLKNYPLTANISACLIYLIFYVRWRPYE